MTNTGLCLTGPMDGEIRAVHNTDVFSVDMCPPLKVSRADYSSPKNWAIKRFYYRLIRFKGSVNFWVPSGWTHEQVISHLAKNYRP